MAVAGYEQNDTLVLENSWVKASIDRKAGVLKSLFDKRTKAEVLQSGIWVELFGEPAPGCFASSILRGADGDAAVLVSGIEWLSRMGWSLQCKLREDSCALYVALTLFCRDNKRDLEVGIRPDVGNFAPVLFYADENTPFSPFKRSAFRIFPFQTIRLRGILLPTGADGGPAVGNGDAALIKLSGETKIVFARTVPDCRVELNLRDGNVLAAMANVSPTQPISLDYNKIAGELVSVRITDRDGDIVGEFKDLSEVNSHAEISESWQDYKSDNHFVHGGDEFVELEMPRGRSGNFDAFERDVLLHRALSPSLAPISYLRLAFLRMGTQEWADAASFVNESLIHNSANPIAWWAKHVCLKKLGEDDPESLANAHFLAPHEPLLKAEAFLQQPDSQSKLLDSYGDDSQPYREVAEFLAEAGLYEELYIWLTESAKRTDDLMITLMLAWLHERAGQKVEAETLLERTRKSEKQIEPIRYMECWIANSYGISCHPL